MYYISSADRRLGTYDSLREAMSAMEEFTTVGGYDMVIVEKVS
jgi:hypothetical protein|tara:strand:- start:1753 stop:1881 length:129 start_codon:yes stop_codon:yes gene_type:complete